MALAILINGSLNEDVRSDIPIGVLSTLSIQDDGAVISYKWSIEFQPADEYFRDWSSDVLSAVDVAAPTITPTQIGRFLIRCILDEGLPTEEILESTFAIRDLRTKESFIAHREQLQSWASKGWSADANFVHFLNTHRLDKDFAVRAKNNYGETLQPLKIVKLEQSGVIGVGTQAENDIHEISGLANAQDWPASSVNAMGILVQSIASERNPLLSKNTLNTKNGLVLLYGLVKGFDTSGRAVGDNVNLSETPGAITFSHLAKTIPIGKVAKVAVNGVIFFDFLTSAFLTTDGNRAMHGALGMGGNKINGVCDPDFPQDAATKKYVDDGLVDNYVITVGDGSNSHGMFEGHSHVAIQAALDAVPNYGGVVLIRGGAYDEIAESLKPKSGTRVIIAKNAILGALSPLGDSSTDGLWQPATDEARADCVHDTGSKTVTIDPTDPLGAFSNAEIGDVISIDDDAASEGRLITSITGSGKIIGYAGTSTLGTPVTITPFKTGIEITGGVHSLYYAGQYACIGNLEKCEIKFKDIDVVFGHNNQTGFFTNNAVYDIDGVRENWVMPSKSTITGIEGFIQRMSAEPGKSSIKNIDMFVPVKEFIAPDLVGINCYNINNLTVENIKLDTVNDYFMLFNDAAKDIDKLNIKNIQIANLKGTLIYINAQYLNELNIKNICAGIAGNMVQWLYITGEGDNNNIDKIHFENSTYGTSSPAIYINTKAATTKNWFINDIYGVVVADSGYRANLGLILLLQNGHIKNINLTRIIDAGETGNKVFEFDQCQCEIEGCQFVFTGDPPNLGEYHTVLFTDSDNCRITGSYLAGRFNSVGGGLIDRSVTIDANSDNNIFAGNILKGLPADAGAGNLLDTTIANMQV